MALQLEAIEKSRDISEYPYTGGATSLFDLLNAQSCPRAAKPSSKFARPWGKEACRELARCMSVDLDRCTKHAFLGF
ncbi:MAG TPA: hypothetical protein VF550_18580, partial [Polyangia bacterium]